MKVGLIDYGRGNLRSVYNACLAVGHEPKMITSAEQLDSLSHLIFPGQGAFGDCMESLQRLGLTEAIKAWIAKDRPYFGICVGYQLLFESSEESPGVAGLGVLAGHVRRFGDYGLKIPHMGWNEARPTRNGDPAWTGLEGDHYFYFVHSYFPTPSDDSLVATRTTYGEEFASAVRRGKLLATQYHPEKSQHAGLTLFRNFLQPA